jgi:hypothetical protein
MPLLNNACRDLAWASARQTNMQRRSDGHPSYCSQIVGRVVTGSVIAYVSDNSINADAMNTIGTNHDTLHSGARSDASLPCAFDGALRLNEMNGLPGDSPTACEQKEP